MLICIYLFIYWLVTASSVSKQVSDSIPTEFPHMKRTMQRVYFQHTEVCFVLTELNMFGFD